MRSIAIVLVLTACAVAWSVPANAAFTLTVMADSTMDGNAGHIVQISEPGYPTEDFFAFDDGGLWRAYAARSQGEDWQLLTPAQYLVPTTNITAGQTWRFLDEGATGRQAEAIGQETVNTPAGSFLCWRVNITALGGVSTSYTAMYWSDGVGLVRENEYYLGELDWVNELVDYDVSSAPTGFFPLAVGHYWDLVDRGVPAQLESMGSIKTRYSN